MKATRPLCDLLLWLAYSVCDRSRQRPRVMSKQANFHECCQAFAASYEISTLPAMQEVERSVLGCDYGGTSWTTRAQAGQIVESLALRPGVHLLEIGAGSGWPGLYLAGSSSCDVTLLDLPASALAKAMRRARDEGNAGRVLAVAASGAALPFRRAAFDAISHSDVLCCLPGKAEMLAECRRVAGDGARMLFSVIYAPPGLSDDAYREAVEVGPPFVDTPSPYAEMLADTGWRLENLTDVTSDYLQSLRRLVREFEQSDALAEVLGREAITESIRHRESQIGVIERGLLVREVFLASAA